MRAHATRRQASFWLNLVRPLGFEPKTLCLEGFAGTQKGPCLLGF